jgi:cellulose synthase/poly-beta-1,6-N-acetylglucosamine synthase-like glycosyltransferase
VLARSVFWGSCALLGWVYAGYPAVAATLARRRPVALHRTRPAPTVTIAIAVHDEADQIEERIRDAFAQDASGASIVEVLVGSDGSTDSTEQLVARLAADEPRLRLVARPRAGQTAAQNELFEMAAGDVVLLTDAETRFAPGCVAALADAMRDERVGCATGRLEWRDENATATSANEGFYWRYERAVRDLESRAGLLTAVTGALLAVRRTAYRPVPPSASMDHLLPLYVREAGGLVVYVPEAVATDRPISDPREQLRNRTRTATRGIRANLSMVGRLAPWTHPGPAMTVWSHKLLRWATPWFVAVAAASGTVLATRGSRGYLAVPAAVAAVGVAAIAADQSLARGERPPRALAFARSLVVVNLAFATGWLNVARGRGIAGWQGAEWKPDTDEA